MTEATVAAVLGAVLGGLSAESAWAGSGLVLIPWALVGLVVGGRTRSSARTTALAGASYGFAVAFSFTAFGYQGSTSAMSRILFFSVLGVIGASCGALLALAGKRAALR